MAETVLITGASSGIGRELAKLFAADGSDLVLVARGEPALRDLADELRARYGTDARVLPHDLTDPAAPLALAGELRDSGTHVDVLVNDAGFGAHGPFAQLPLERQVEMVQLNVAALTALSRLFLPEMLARRRGGILNVGSTAGFQPGPYMAVYYATKAYVLSFTEGLAGELAGTGVTATCLAPGTTRTGFSRAAGMEGSNLFRPGTMGAAEVARAGHRGFRAGRALVVPGILHRTVAALSRAAPLSLTRRIAARLNGNGE
ncbi:MAG TPA: SDR family oxidoreductase [Longimicrobiaceae bacterium]|nr:SDR family oxidoreductase [Longimicrobiaceae bacterium]